MTAVAAAETAIASRAPGRTRADMKPLDVSRVRSSHWLFQASLGRSRYQSRSSRPTPELSHGLAGSVNAPNGWASSPWVWLTGWCGKNTEVLAASHLEREALVGGAGSTSLLRLRSRSPRSSCAKLPPRSRTSWRRRDRSGRLDQPSFGVAHYHLSCPSLSETWPGMLRQERFDPSRPRRRCSLCWPRALHRSTR